MNEIDHNAIRQDLLAYLVTMHFNEYEGDVHFDTPLLELGIIDSLSMMTCILFLEQKYGLDFFEIDVSRNDFASINTIATLVARSLEMQKTAVAAQ